MDNSLLVCLSHQLAKQRTIDSIANNIANVNTSGFRGEALQFSDYIHPSKPSAWQRGPQSIDFVVNSGSVRDMSQGRIETTGNPFDLAVNGNGYFAVQTPRGERFTRDGHFTLDSQGQIVTEAGDPVLSDGGPVTIANEDGDIVIGEDGTVSGDQGQIAKLRVVQFTNERAMTREGNNYYAAREVPQNAQDGYAVKQGMLERSNIEPISEMTDMINVMRSYQAVANLINSQESLKRTAINKLSGASSS